MLHSSSERELGSLLRTATRFACAFMAVAALSAPALAQNEGPLVDVSTPAAPGELIVKFKKQVTQKRRNEIVKRVVQDPRRQVICLADGTCKIEVLHDMSLVRLNAGMSRAEAIQKLARDGNTVEWVEPNYYVYAIDAIDSSTATNRKLPNDWADETSKNRQWTMDNTGQSGGKVDADIDAPEAWKYGTGSKDIVVAVIDTGIDYTHPDLKPNMWVNPKPTKGDIHGYDFAENDADPMDVDGHGTHCAGVIGAAGNDGSGFAGVNWNVKLMALRFLGTGGRGTIQGAIDSIRYAVDNGAHVLSNSWGGGGRSRALEEVINYAHSKGVVFVAAAGNSNTSRDTYPASFNHVIAVAATDRFDQRARFSNFGSYIDLAAPGVDVWSTWPVARGNFRSISGTSMACPHVSGVAALMLSHNKGMTPDQVERVLETSSDDIGEEGWDIKFGAGRLNAARAVKATLEGNFDFPEVKLTSPFNGEVVTQELMIQGTVTGFNLLNYRLEIASAQRPFDWVPIVRDGVQPLNNGLFAMVAPERLAVGGYMLRLTVRDRSGREYSDVIRFTRFDEQPFVPFPIIAQNGSDDLTRFGADGPGELGSNVPGRRAPAAPAPKLSDLAGIGKPRELGRGGSFFNRIASTRPASAPAAASAEAEAGGTSAEAEDVPTVGLIGRLRNR